MVIVLLTAILVAMGFKSSQFNETVTGNAAEYQRVYEAAQALVRDAELDILSQRATGNACQTNCRTYGQITASSIYFPDATELPAVRLALTDAPQKCIAGICWARSPGNEDFWTNTSDLRSMQARGASYGQFTDGARGTTTNPRLTTCSNTPPSACYWVEILPYSVTAQGGTALEPNGALEVVYRITAVVEGRRNTVSAIQKLVVPKTEEI
jgi:type IV pilus assembly protein PilX